MTTAFIVLPYLYTDKPLSIAGIIFTNSSDEERFTEEEIEELRHIRMLFYLDEEKPVDEILVAKVQLSENADEREEQVTKVRSAHTLLSFLLLNRPDDAYEQMMLYWIVPREVPVFDEEQARRVDGYSMTVNWRHWIEVPRGTRVYPPLPSLLFSKNIPSIQDQLLHDGHLRDLYDFLRGSLLNRPEQSSRYETLLRAMDWYTRSFSAFISPDEEVIELAVSFETLFHEQGSKERIPSEIKKHLRALFGDAPRLQDWVEQFYDERSRIVHEGFAENYRFVSKARGPDEEPLQLDALVNYGRRLLRMCIFNILHATYLANEAKIGAWFTHNQETLENLCEKLTNRDATPSERLTAATPLVFDLEVMWRHYSGQRDIRLRTLRTTARLLIDNYLEAIPEIDESLKESMEKVKNLDLDQLRDLYAAYRELSQKLGQGLGTYRGQYWPRESQQTLAHFFDYASSHHVGSLIRTLAEEE